MPERAGIGPADWNPAEVNGAAGAIVCNGRHGRKFGFRRTEGWSYENKNFATVTSHGGLFGDHSVSVVCYGSKRTGVRGSEGDGGEHGKPVAVQ